MTVSESDRRALYNDLETTLGEKSANSLMHLLPFHSTDQLVTRDDLHANTIMLRGEMAELRSELRGEMTELRSELRGEMTELRGEIASLDGSIAAVGGKVEAQIGSFQARTDRLFGVSVALNAVALASAGFF